MKYQVEESLRDFNAWSGGKDTLETLIERGDCDEVESLIESLIEDMFYGSEELPSDTAINDCLWFERDAIAQHLGYSDWEMYELNISETDEEEAEDWWDGLDEADKVRISGEEDEIDSDCWWSRLSTEKKYELYEMEDEK